LAADMKFMKGHHRQTDQPDTGVRDPKDTDSVRGMELVGSKAEHQVQRYG
jgi:hypothetical protein